MANVAKFRGVVCAFLQFVGR